MPTQTGSTYISARMIDNIVEIPRANLVFRPQRDSLKSSQAIASTTDSRKRPKKPEILISLKL